MSKFLDVFLYDCEIFPRPTKKFLVTSHILTLPTSPGEKAEKNWQKHKVRFEIAARVFLDDYRFDDYDELHSDFENRIKTVGFVRNVLAVIYTERGEVNRIISARRADKDEEANYFGQFEQ